MRRAGLSVTDKRTMNRNRRLTEKKLGVTLPPHNPQFKPANEEVQCPSYLDYKKALKHKFFVITSATNNSPLNEKFLDALEAFCEAKSGQLLVCPIRYWNNELMGKADYKWDSRLYPYVITDRDFIIHKTALQVSALTSQATAANPLSGMQSLGGRRSVIYGATSLHQQPVASHGRDPAKLLMTTGAVTGRRYLRGKAGQKAAFHHNFCAVAVLLVKNTYYHTQLMWDGKGFTFLNEYWTPDGKRAAPRSEAISRGDEHAEWAEPHILKARKRACDRLNPKTHIFHDVWDGISVSHHAKLIDQIHRYNHGMHCLESGLKKTADLIDKWGGEVNVIVDSNHDRHLERYVNEGRHLKEPHNTVLASQLLAQSVKSGKSMLQCYLEDNCKSKLVFPDCSKPYLIKNIDCGQHGDRGPNGSRGSIRSFAKGFYKSITGHSHSAWIFQGAWSNGVSTMLMTFMKGLSSWTYTDTFIAANGKRFQLFYINGKSLVDFM